MIPIRQLRNDFLATFPHPYRDHIIDFARKLATLDVDVLLLTARKAVCLMHCFKLLGLFVPRRKFIVISERCLDHDGAWLSGKRVAIIDEVIVTGTTLYKLHDRLQRLGVLKIEVHCLFTNRHYFVKELFDDIALSDGYIRLQNGEAQALSTAIVDAIYKVPRPYSVDYPMSTWITVSAHQLQRLIMLPGWETIERHWVAPITRDSSATTVLYRVTPQPELRDSIDTAIGINVSGAGLVKVRLYGRRSGSESHGSYEFRAVPYVVLGELDVEEFDRVFNELSAPLNEEDRKVVATSCTTDQARLRFIQYILSIRLAHEWIRALRSSGLQIEFTQDAAELDYLFPPDLHRPIDALSRHRPQSGVLVSWAPHPTVVGGGEFKLDSIPRYFDLAEPFRRMYFERELEFRKLALRYGKRAVTDEEFALLRDRLEEGLSLDALRREAAQHGISVTSSLLSDFLDLSIDTGVIVPITMRRQVGNRRVLCRAFRHGEETYILTRDVSMFHAMLKDFAKVMARDSALAPQDDNLVRFPRIMIEKIMVLFLRYAIGMDILRSSHERLDPVEGLDSDAIPVNVGYHLHGARIAIGHHDPTEFPPEHAFANFLVREEILLKEKDSSGYLIAGTYSHATDLDPKRSAASQKFGGVMARIMSLPPSILEVPEDQRIWEDVNEEKLPSPSALRDRMLIALTSCETASSTLTAVGAEMRLLCERFRSGFSIRPDQWRTTLERLSTYNTRFYINNALAKISAHLDRIGAQTARNIQKALQEDPAIAGVWTEIWGAAILHRSHQEEREANRELLNCWGLLVRLDFGMLLLRHEFRCRVWAENKQSAASEHPPSDSPNTPGSSSQVTPSPPDCDSLIRRLDWLETRSKELSARSAAPPQDVLGKQSQRVYKGFAKEAELAARDCRQLLTRWHAARSLKSVFVKKLTETLNQQLNEAARRYKQVDERYRDRGAVSSLSRFDNVLVGRLDLSALDTRLRKVEKATLFDQLIAELSRANTGVRPRSYRKGGAANLLGQTLTYDTREALDHIVIRIFGTGVGVPEWFAYLTATLFRDTDPTVEVEVGKTWFALFGLDDTRGFSKIASRCQMLGNADIEQLIAVELAQLTPNSGKLVITGTVDHRRALQKSFHGELSEVLKTRTPDTVVAETVAQHSLSASHITVATYGRSSTRRATEQQQLSLPVNQSDILLFATEWQSREGGLSTFNRELCKALVECGARVACAVPPTSQSEAQEDAAAARKAGVTLIYAEPVSDENGRVSLYLPLELPLAFIPTVVIGHARITGPMAQHQAKTHYGRAKRVHFVHMAPGEIEWRKNEENAAERAEAREKLERDLARESSLVVAVGERLGREFGNLLIADRVPFHIFEPGLLAERVTKPPPLDLCLIAGRMKDAPLKGLDIAAEALALVLKRGRLKGRTPELLIRGAAPGTEKQLREELRKYSQGADLDSRIRLFDGRPEIIQHDIQRSSVVLMPSRCEGFGLIALEAISMGVPTLISEKSGLADMLRKYAPDMAEWAIVPVTQDREQCSAQWCTRIEEVLLDKAQSWRRAAELRERINRSVTWGQSAQRLLERIQALGN